ncbi:MAG TPA: hypothetical protein PK667_02095 [Nitrosomonas europaea]|uniref:hypothetical protein n=2 Tax=Nitrosomonas europaea TaxID=915 RepID=UPI000795B6EE|nr:hypothetical protein [Nitrosomonas europaea]KXK41473.1 MAG: hypothetical protein UZ02_AOB001001693 [Nitrosomonas europaea]HNS58350.1 hypothetical protein [Nitrosomonas europaea]HRN81124.1 hypothetical protein [Nitrosomonas europaea]HRO55315.1 hypothetical protein [Nitrosomonas europaea]HRQ07760.1 hypothetical protein [Nitrosomonas europaea]
MMTSLWAAEISKGTHYMLDFSRIKYFLKLFLSKKYINNHGIRIHKSDMVLRISHQTHTDFLTGSFNWKKSHISTCLMRNFLCHHGRKKSESDADISITDLYLFLCYDLDPSGNSRMRTSCDTSCLNESFASETGAGLIS